MTRRLVIANGRGEREILLVGNITIGRDPACHVTESDPLLSRRHAEIVAGVDGVTIRDLNSRNGLLVNGQKRREQVLLPGDVVQMGHLQLRYVEDHVRGTEGVSTRGMRQRRQAPPTPSRPLKPSYDLDRFRPESTPPPRRWTPEPTPRPSRRTTTPPQQPRGQNSTPVPRGRAAFDESAAEKGRRGPEAFEPTMAGPLRPSHHDTTLGHPPANLDATMMEPRRPTRSPSGVHRGLDLNATMMGSVALPDATTGPGTATFAAALAHLAGLAEPARESVQLGLGAHLVANAELTVTDATPACADLLGIPDEELIGNSLTDVFLRGVRRAYAEPDATLSLSISRGAHGSITITFSLDRTGGTE